jgi:hypothetical protein
MGKAESVTQMLDFFRLESCGVLWLASATSLESAQARAQEFAVDSPGDYLVLDLETGNKHVLKLGSVDESADNRRTEVGNHG